MGLTRIELVTSSLSGMRSNQLSYSPELLGTKSLTALFVTLNRGQFFLQNRHTNPADEISDEVEDDRSQDPQNGAQRGKKEPEEHHVHEQFASVEDEGLPTEALEERLNVVDGAGC